MLFRLFFLVGVLIRNTDIFKYYKFLKSTEGWTSEQLEVHQLKQLKKLLSIANEESAYYKKKFSDLGFSLDQITSLADITKLPMLTKQELLEHVTEIQVEARSDIRSETSGSTGTPLLFYRNKEWDASHRAAIYRGYSWHGVKPWYKNGYFWGFNKKWQERVKTRIFDWTQNRFRLFSYNASEIETFLRKMRNAKYLEGYSSMIHQVALSALEASNPVENKLLMIKGTSEKIHDSYQETVQQAFGKKIISEYGAAEAGIMAFECAHGQMHITAENAIVEVVNGEIVVTNLYSYALPIIRYKLGDYIVMKELETPCKCGMVHPVILDIEGRVGKEIHGFKQKYPSLTLYYVSKNIALEHNIFVEYQAIQERPGHIDYFIFGEISEAVSSLILNEFEKYYGADLIAHIKQGNRGEERTGKKKDFISKLEN